MTAYKHDIPGGQKAGQQNLDTGNLSTSWKITPGPWRIREIEGHTFDQIDDGDGFTICDVEHQRLICDGGNYIGDKSRRDASPGEGAANARAIAALPDLIEAAEDAEWALYEALGEEVSTTVRELLNGALLPLRAALSRAKGETE